MKRLYLLMIALTCAVCVNAESKTAVFDFAGNPWAHALGYGSGTTADPGNVDQLTADDETTVMTFAKGSNATSPRMWDASKSHDGSVVQFRGYNGNVIAVQSENPITKITVYGSASKLFLPPAFEQNTANTEATVTLDAADEITEYSLNPTGSSIWTKVEVTYEVADGPAGDPTLSETNVTDLATLGNKKAYALHALSGEGFWCYNPEVHASNVAICGVTDHSYQGSVGNAAWEASFDPANPNHQWQILTFQDKHYIYNLGAKKYIALTGGTYVFTDTPTAMEFRVNAETETVNGKPALTLGGTFSIRPLGGGSTDYTCICTKNTDNPLKFWTYNDHGGPMLITEIENVSDDAAITGLEEAVAQQERTAEWNALLAAAKAEYNANSSYTIGDNIITDPTWFSSPHTSTAEGDIKKLTDGDCKTYWHSDWTKSVAAHTHYLQVSLPEAIAGLTQMTMGRRDNNGAFCDNDNPVRMSVEFSADGESFSEPTYFDTPFTQTIEDPYVKVTFNVPEGTKYLRFYNEQSNGSLQRGYWHCGEMQLNPATLDPNCTNAQNAEVAEEFGLFLEQCDEKDPATIADAHIAILKATMATYHFETHLYTAAELNALENNVKAKVGEMEVVYVNGQYNYIKDATGTALLYASASDYHLTAGDKVQGLVVVGAPYNGLPEVKPVSEFADLTIIPNAEYTFAPAEATEVPTAEGVNQIWKYVGVQAKAAAAFTTASASNLTGTWHETDLTFRNNFKHLEATFEEGKYYTIVAATAVYNGNVQLYAISAEEETASTEVTYTVKFGEETIATEQFVETVGEAPKFTLEVPDYVTVSGMPETIEEGTTEITLTTELNEKAPFQDLSKLYYITLANGGNTYWFNDDESGKLNELRSADGVSEETLDEASRWQIGGDWKQGFTLKNAKTGNYVAAGDNHNNGTNVLMGETPEKYTLVKNATGWRFAVEDTYLAHTSHNSHIVSYWSEDSYAANYVFFSEYEEPTEPTNYEKLLAAVAQLEEICAANQVDITGYDEEGYPEFTSLAGKVGYKPEVALYSIVDSYDFLTYFTENEEITDDATFNAAYAEYYEVVGEFWKDDGFDTPLEYELSYVDEAFELYSMAALCMPEAGKYYTIRNANKFSSEEDGDKEYSYYFTTTTEGALGLKSMLEATVEHEDIWQADKFTYSESETRYTFKNVVTGTYLGHSEGNSLTLLAEAGQSACFYMMAYNAEIPVYGTLGMQYNNGGNEYRWSTIDMREPGSYTAGNNPNFDNTYSSFVWIEEVEGFDPETVGLGTVIAPATSERIYNLQGQLQNRMHRGINIRSGKKVMK